MMAISSHPSAAMATITIRNVPEPLHQLLKERADRAGRSLNAELIQILMIEVSQKPKRDTPTILAELRAFRESLPPMPEVSVEELRRWIDEGRE
jgi:plasmid stability protein